MKLLVVVAVLSVVVGQVQTSLKGSNGGNIWQQNDNNKVLTPSKFRQVQGGNSKQSIVQQSLLAVVAEDENRRLDTTQVTFFLISLISTTEPSISLISFHSGKFNESFRHYMVMMPSEHPYHICRHR